MADLSCLSPREAEVLRLISQGRSGKEISLDLGTSLGTVRQQTSNTFKKLGVRNRIQAALVFHGVEKANG